MTIASREYVRAKIRQAKDRGLALPVVDEAGVLLSTLKVCAGTEEEARLAAAWREREKQWFPTLFPFDPAGTLRWLKQGVLGNPERILFFLEDPAGVPWGHAGLALFQWGNPPSCEIDSILRGRADVARGAMTPVLRCLIAWAKEELGMPRVELKVFSENEKAIRLYERLGFCPVRSIPMKLRAGTPVSVWEECLAEEAERQYLVMAWEE